MRRSLDNCSGITIPMIVYRFDCVVIITWKLQLRRTQQKARMWESGYRTQWQVQSNCRRCRCRCQSRCHSRLWTRIGSSSGKERQSVSNPLRSAMRSKIASDGFRSLKISTFSTAFQRLSFFCFTLIDWPFAVNDSSCVWQRFVCMTFGKLFKFAHTKLAEFIVIVKGHWEPFKSCCAVKLVPVFNEQLRFGWKLCLEWMLDGYLL